MVASSTVTSAGTSTTTSSFASGEKGGGGDGGGDSSFTYRKQCTAWTFSSTRSAGDSPLPRKKHSSLFSSTQNSRLKPWQAGSASQASLHFSTLLACATSNLRTPDGAVDLQAQRVAVEAWAVSQLLLATVELPTLYYTRELTG